MADVTVAAIEEMESIYDGVARRARATSGVSSFGMQVMTLPPGWEGYPDHVHDGTVEDANQEGVYIPLRGSATLIAGTESIKWKTPTFAFNGNIVSFNPSKRLVSILFHRGAEIPGDHPQLEGDGKLARTMRFIDLDEVEACRAAHEAVIRASCDWRAGASRSN